MKNIFIFDVESCSLFGEGFAVGAMVADPQGNEIETFELLSTYGRLNTNEWVTKNVLPHLTQMPTYQTNQQLRNQFYSFYCKHKNTCDIWADCCFPVETNFLKEIVADDPEHRQQLMPYPLKDISTLISINIDRTETCNIPNLRKHHPLDDCRASLFHLTHFIKNNPCIVM